MQREGGESVLEQIERCSPHCVRWQMVPQVDDAREEGVLVGVDAAVVLLQLQMVATGCSVGVYDMFHSHYLLLLVLQETEGTVEDA